jgi:hypothetical protein
LRAQSKRLLGEEAIAEDSNAQQQARREDLKQYLQGIPEAEVAKWTEQGNANSIRRLHPTSTAVRFRSDAERWLGNYPTRLNHGIVLNEQHL